MTVLDKVIRGGSVVTPEGVQSMDVGISGGRIEVLGTFPVPAAEVIDARGCIVLPGCIDAHTHFQPKLPGGGIDSFIEWSDDFTSGTVSAACGGVTTVVDFAVQGDQPGDRVTDAVDAYREIAGRTAVVDFGLHAGLTQATKETIEEVPGLVSQGVTSFKLFRTYKKWGIYTDLGFINELFPLFAGLGVVAAVHCENDEILSYLRAKYISEGHEYDLRYHVLSRPPLAEEVAIDEVAALARVHGTRAYPVHLSSARGLAAVRRARAAGRLACEVGLHFLFMTDEVFEGPDAALYFMTPPFRKQEDIDALWDGIADGSIDWVATDHSPHLAQEKRRDPKFSPSADGLEFSIPPGFTGIEEMLPLMYTRGVASGKFSLNRLAEIVATSAARELGMPAKGSISVGKDADLVVYDPSVERRITIGDLHTRADYTIYEGIPVKGRVRDTFCRGDQVVRDAEYVGGERRGRFIERVVA